MNDESNFLLNEVKAAIAVQHNENSSSHDRQVAFEFCNNNSSFERHFGGRKIARLAASLAHLLEQLLLHIIKTKWHFFSYHDRHKIRDIVVDFIKAGTKDVLSEDSFIKVKVAEVFVEIAKRDWPDFWQAKLFKKTVMAMARCGDQQTELVLLILEALALEVYQYPDNIPKKRRALVVQALSDQSGAYYGFTYKTLCAHYTRYKQDGDATALLVLKAGLKTFLAFCTGIDITKVTSVSYWELFAVLLKEPGLRVTAAECLQELLKRQFKRVGFDAYRDHILLPCYELLPSLGESFAFNMMNGQSLPHAMLRLLQQQHHQGHEGNLAFAEHYAFQRAAVEVIATIGTQHLTHAMHVQSQHAELLLKMMLELCGHASPFIFSRALGYWGTFLQSQAQTERELTSAIALPLINQLDSKGINYFLICKKNDNDISGLSEKEVETVKYVEYDFCNNDADPKAISFYLDSVIPPFEKVLQQLSLHFSELMMEYLLEKSKRVVMELENRNQAYPIKEHSKLMHILNLLKIEIAAVLDAFDLSNANLDVLSATERVLAPIYQYNPQEPLLIVAKLNVLTAFRSYYDARPASLEFVLTSVIHFLTYLQPNEHISNLSKDTMFIRTAATNILFELASSLPKTLSQQLPTLLRIIGSLFDSKKLIPVQEQRILRSMLSISNGLFHYSDRLSFYQALLASYVNEWASAELTATLSTVPRLLDFMGVDADSGKQQEVARRASKFVTLLSLFYHAWSIIQLPTLHGTDYSYEALGFGPVQHEVQMPGQDQGMGMAQGLTLTFAHALPQTQMAVVLIPNICQVVKVLHQLWSPPCRTLVPERYQSLFQASDTPAEINYNMEVQADDEVEPAQVKDYLERARHISYFLLGKFIEEGEAFFTRPDLANHLQLIFTHVQYMYHAHHLDFLRHVVNPLIEHTPAQFYPMVLPLLYDAFVVIFRNLTSAWQEYLALKEKQTNENDIKRTIKKELVLLSLAQAYPLSLQRLLLRKNKKGSQHQRLVLVPTNQFQYMLNAGVLQELIVNMVHLVFIDSQVASARAAEMLARIFPAILADPTAKKYIVDAYVEIFIELFASLLRAVQASEMVWRNDYNDSLFKLFAVIFIAVLDRGRSEETEKLLGILPNMTNEHYERFKRQYQQVSLPVAGKKAGKRNKKGKQNVIWDLLEKLGIVKLGSTLPATLLSETADADEMTMNNATPVSQSPFAKAAVKQDDDLGISFDQIAELFGAL